MRILDRMKIPYDTLQYQCDTFIDGIHAADTTGVDHDISYKTLVAQGKSGAYYVFVLPIEREVHLKRAAAVVAEKSVEMIHVKDITAVTGYVRGGCSPLGMKKQYRTIVHSDAADHEKIYVSGGRIGSSILLSPGDLLRACGGEYGDICED